MSKFTGFILDNVGLLSLLLNVAFFVTKLAQISNINRVKKLYFSAPTSCGQNRTLRQLRVQANAQLLFCIVPVTHTWRS